MLAFLLLGTCGCLGGLEAPQSIYVAQTASQPTEGQGAGQDRFAPRREGGLVVIAPPVSAGSSEVARSADGLFYVTAIVNGVPVRFLVDTGASMIVLRPEDARRAGVWADDEDAFRHSAETAGGRTAMARVTLDEVVVGTTRQKALAAAVVRNDMPVSLLGQNWVEQLASLTISGNRMRFN